MAFDLPPPKAAPQWPPGRGKPVEVYVQGLGRVPTTTARLRAWYAWLKSPAGRAWWGALQARENQGLDVLGLR